MAASAAASAVPRQSLVEQTAVIQAQVAQAAALQQQQRMSMTLGGQQQQGGQQQSQQQQQAQQALMFLQAQQRMTGMRPPDNITHQQRMFVSIPPLYPPSPDKYPPR